MRMKRWIQRVRETAESVNVLFMNIWGVSGSGKTNLALYIAENLDDMYNHILYLRLSDVTQMREILHKNSILIFEDFTYLASKHSRAVDKFLRELMMIRHRVEKAAIIIISHYFASVLPALRLSHVRALTSLTSTSEIKQFKALFDLNALWDYYHLYTRNINKYYALINALGKHYIVRPKLSKYYERVLAQRKSIILK